MGLEVQMPVMTPPPNVATDADVGGDAATRSGSYRRRMRRRCVADLLEAGIRVMGDALIGVDF